jgi:hypothetical protein
MCPDKESSVEDPDPGFRCLFFTPGSGMGKKSRSRSGMNIQDHISENLDTNFWDKNANPGSGIFLTLDPGWKNSDPG